MTEQLTTASPRKTRTYDVEVVQLELTEGTSDKYYRLFEMYNTSTGAYVLVRQWGRRGAKGQIKVQKTPHRYTSEYAAFRELEDAKRYDKGYTRIAKHQFSLDFDVPPTSLAPADLVDALMSAFSDAWFEDSLDMAARRPVYYDENAQLLVRIPAARITAAARPAAGRLLDGFASSVLFEDTELDVLVARIQASVAAAAVDVFDSVEFTVASPSDTQRTVQTALALMSRGARRSGFTEAMGVARRIEV